MKKQIIPWFLFISFVVIYSCQQKEKLSPPEVKTVEVKNVTYKGAYVVGALVSQGEIINSKGICFAKFENPTINDNTVIDQWNISTQYGCNLENLSPNTTYYARAFATSGVGTGYGEQLQFKTLLNFSGQSGTVLDVDGNTYHTIGIGSQIWTVENLRTTHFTDGTEIPNVTTNATWSSAITPAYCFYNNDASNKSVYGALYNWYALDLTNNNKKLCPAGWHIPTNDEWTVLITDLGEMTAGDKLRESGNSHWLKLSSPGTNTNETEFTALPSGQRYSTGDFDQLGKAGLIWSSWAMNGVLQPAFMFFEITGPFCGRVLNKNIGCSVRCIKD